LKQEETYYSPEELIAMLMQHAKDMALSQGGKVIKDCVVTVPSSFTQHERKALYTAAEIADLKVLLCKQYICINKCIYIYIYVYNIKNIP
jgi:molecular chaperone DnaK (HSP70)